MGGMVPASVSPGCDCSLGKETPGGGGGDGRGGGPQFPPTPHGGFPPAHSPAFPVLQAGNSRESTGWAGRGHPSVVCSPPPAGGRDRPSPRLPPGLGALVKLGGGGALCVSLSPSPVGTGPPPLPWSSPHRVSRGVLGPARPPVWGVLVTSLGLGLGLGRGGEGRLRACAGWSRPRLSTPRPEPLPAF